MADANGLEMDSDKIYEDKYQKYPKKDIKTYSADLLKSAKTIGILHYERKTYRVSVVRVFT